MSHSPAGALAAPPDPDYAEGWSKITDLIETGGSWSGRERNCCFLNTGGGRFADISFASGLDFPDDARAVGVVDWDHDGDLDLWITNRTAPRLRYLANNGTPGHRSIQFRLEGRTGNRDAIGARLVLELGDRTLVKGVCAGSGYLSQSSRTVHFGLGDADTVGSLSVRWPGGATETFEQLEPGGRYTIVEGTGTAGRLAVRTPPVVLEPGALPVVPATARARIALMDRLPLPRLEFLDDNDQPQPLPPGPLLINLWATWCVPCVAELGEFTREADRLREAGLNILALSVDGLKDGKPVAPDRLRKFLADHEFTIAHGRADSHLVDKLDTLHDAVLSIRTRTDAKNKLPVPASFLVDRSGRLVMIYKGPVSVETLLADVASLDTPADRSVPHAGRWFLRPHGLAGVMARVGDRLVRRGYLDDAERQARLAADLVARNGGAFGVAHRIAGVFSDVGNAHDEQNRLDDAERAYRAAIEVEPHGAGSLVNLGNVHFRRGEHDRAERRYRQALDLNPRLLQARMNLGNICLAGKRFAEAQRHFEVAVQINPRFPQAHNYLGLALFEQGLRDRARDQFAEALKLDPDYADARENFKAAGGAATPTGRGS